MKIYIICCVPAQIPYLWKFLFLRYGPKCSQPIRLQNFLIKHISKQISEIAWCFACWYKFRKLKFDQKVLIGHGRKWVWPVWSWDSKIDCISRMNWWNELIFACWCKFRKSKSFIQWFSGGRVQKCVLPFSSWGPRICCIVRMSLWTELIFCKLTVMQ